MNIDDHGWDVDVIAYLFNLGHQQLILSIPASNKERDDALIW